MCICIISIMGITNLLKLKKTKSIGDDGVNKTRRNYILGWVGILVLTTLAGIWIWITVEMYNIMPHTFSWEMLLRTFGLSFSIHCINGTANTTEAMDEWPPAVDCITISHSIPCVPCIVTMILFITLSFGIVSLIPVSPNTKSSAAYGVSVITTWHICFVIVSIIVVSIYFNMDSNSVRPAMLKAMESSKNQITDIWTITQITDECCGIESYKDWDWIINNGSYPSSCYCNNATSQGSPCNIENVWAQGCLRKEEFTVEIYGSVQFLLLCFGVAVGIIFWYLIDSLKPGSPYEDIVDVELETPLLKK